MYQQITRATCFDKLLLITVVCSGLELIPICLVSSSEFNQMLQWQSILVYDKYE